jgi:SHS2 domain-containing protein
MADRFEFFEHTADIGVHIYGASLPELFQNAAAALYEAMGTLAKSDERREKRVRIEAGALEDLLHDWLTELLYEIEANHVLLDEIVSLQAGRGGDAAPTWELRAELRGATIDFTQSQTNEEIKAVTYHQLRVEQLLDGTWRATVIFDV